MTDADPGEHPSQEELDAWTQDILDEDRSSKIEKHLELCEECTRKLNPVSKSDTELLRLLRLGPSKGWATVHGTDAFPSAIFSSADFRGRDTYAPDAGEARQTRVYDSADRLDSRDPQTNVAEDDSSDHSNEGGEYREVRSGEPLSTVGGTARWIPERIHSRGGIGEVWVTRDILLNQRVALKRLKKNVANRQRVQQRFLREARITASISHPGTVGVLDLIDDGANSYYVMSWIEGTTLTAAISSYHRLRKIQNDSNVEELVRLLSKFVQVAEAIAFAHLRGIIHRDIKGDNVLIGEYGQVTLVDWGLAKRIGDPELEADAGAEIASHQSAIEVLRTKVGARVGTPAYMSPEQVRGENASITESTDVYSLCAMLHEIVVGRPPFEAKTVEKMFDAILNNTPSSFASHQIYDLDEIEEVCMRGLSKDPQQRPSSVSEIIDVVRKWTTNQIRRQQTQSEREQFFSLTDDAMALLDFKLKITWANPAWKSQTGWDPDELVGKPFTELMHPTDAFDVNDVFEKLRVEGGSELDIEPRMLCQDGQYRFFNWTVAALSNESAIYAIGHDVDERRRREETQRELLDGTPDALVVIDESKQIVVVNQQFETLFGHDRKDVIGQPLEILMPGRFRAHHPSLVANYMESPTRRSLDDRLELRALRSDGEEIPVQISLSPVATGQGRMIVAAIRPLNENPKGD